MTSPVPEPQCPITSTPGTLPDRVLGQPAGRARRARGCAALEVEAALGHDLRLVRQRLQQPVAQHPELQPVEQLVGRLAVPRAAQQILGASGRSRSSTSALICRLRSTSSTRSWNASAALPLSSPAWAARFSSPSYISSHLAAVLGPTPGTPGQIVAGLPDQRRQVGVTRGGGEVAFLDRLRGHPAEVGDPFAGIEHGDVVADQLERVPVAGADQHVVTRRLGLRGQGADHVVGLEALLLDVGGC